MYSNSPTSTNEYMNTVADEALESYISLVAAGSRDAVAKLYESTKTAVYGFALSITKDTHDAKDVLQETYVRVWSKAAGYTPHGKPMAWILTIAKNLALGRLRERSKNSAVPEGDWQRYYAEHPTITSDDRLVLDAAMQTLTDEERQIVMLFAVTGLKHREIGSMLSLPLPTVLSKYQRACKKLRTLLKEGD